MTDQRSQITDQMIPESHENKILDFRRFWVEGYRQGSATSKFGVKEVGLIRRCFYVR